MNTYTKTMLMASAISLLISSHASAFCYEQAGQQYKINASILRAISKHESNNDPATIHYNENGSYDVGLMGINSIHARYLGPKKWSMMREPCTNVMTGASILRDCLNKYGYNWLGIGCFNSQTPKFRDKYARKIYNLIFKEQTRVGQNPVETQPTQVATGNVSWAQDGGAE
jgi:hypothetical protein